MPNNDRTRRGRHALILACAVFAGFFTLSPRARADQAGVPFWQSGSYASLAAAPASPGWSLTVAPDYYGVGPGAKPFKIGTTVVSGLKVDSAYVGLALGYAPKARFLGGQLDFTLGWGVGADTTAATVKLSNPPESFVGSQSVFGGFDLAPLVSLAWNKGVSNWMVYASGNIPIGVYDPESFATLGIGHGAVDIGGGYTYFDPAKGHEFTAVVGTTLNLENGRTHYTNGVDVHLDWAASQFLTPKWEVGVVGYVYDQVSPDSGAGDLAGAFESRIAAVGPEVGYLFPFAGKQAYINLRGYWEFWAENRVEGHGLYLTVTLPLSPAPKK